MDGAQAVGNLYQALRTDDPEVKKEAYINATSNALELGANFIPYTKQGYKIAKKAVPYVTHGAQALMTNSDNNNQNSSNAVITQPFYWDSFIPHANGGKLVQGRNWHTQLNYTPNAMFMTTPPPRKRVVYKSLSGRVFNTRAAMEEDNERFRKKQGSYAQPTQIKYTVKSGDNLWNIAKANNIDLDTLYKYNPQYRENSIIHQGDEIIVGEKDAKNSKSLYNVKTQWREDSFNNKDNLRAIQSVNHDGNYVVIDKKNKTLNVFDKNNKLLYQSHDISTGASGDDYNTITYVDKQGKIRDKQGNNSTPAGITQITGTGIYHGLPSFTRGRRNAKGDWEDIASSFHYGNTEDSKSSNGCVRMGGTLLKDLQKYVGKGTNVYTLPEKGGSRFVARDGKLSFIADNPYGNDKGDKRYWDDYNVYTDKTYSPLVIKSNTKGSAAYKKNEQDYINSLVNNKEKIMQTFGISSDTYNHIANLALGLAQQESQFGTADSYYNKVNAPDWVNKFGRAVKAKFKGSDRSFADIYNVPLSRGYTQMKVVADSKQMQQYYKNLGLSEDSLIESAGDVNSNVATNSALATVARLAYMYQNEVQGRNFKGAEGYDIDSYDALLYKWMGKDYMLRNGKAIPDNNTYLNAVKGYADNYDLFSER